MSRELDIAYPRIKRQWPGLVIRQHQPRIKGWPDFILIDGEVIFAEVKWIKNVGHRPVLDPTQAHWLEELRRNGAIACLLVGHPDGWVAWQQDFQRFTKAFNDTDLPNANWSGKMLAEFSTHILWERLQ